MTPATEGSTERKEETQSSGWCRDGRPRRDRGTVENWGAAAQAHDKERSCFFAKWSAFLGRGVWGEQTLKFVLNVRVSVTSQGTGLNGHGTQGNLEMWRVRDGRSPHPWEVFNPTKKWT